MPAQQQAPPEGQVRGNFCPLYHEAVELVGRRWTGALLWGRMTDLEAGGVVHRTVIPGPPLRVQYELSRMGHELEPALSELQSWARRWLGDRAAAQAAAQTSRS